MCAIAGIMMLMDKANPDMEKYLQVMNELQAHRGPDGEGIWVHEHRNVGFAHRRLSIIELSDMGKQPMTDGHGNWICFNGELYNYLELRKELNVPFVSNSDTEVVLEAYKCWGTDCVSHFKGMFAFAIWDEKKQKLFCVRDRFGIKPFYYTIQKGMFIFASEMKALLPFLEEIETDVDAFKDYLTFQFCLGNKTLFKGITELEAAHFIEIEHNEIKEKQYWQLYYNLDWNHTEKYFTERLEELLEETVKYHIRSDVPIGGYVSGGVDSSVISILASKMSKDKDFMGFTGKFSIGPKFDESRYAEDVAKENGFPLKQIDITCQDFINNIEKVIYYLDTPVAGPGSFCQYMVSELAAKDRKVVLGGQGGDEIFGGYTRYLIAYFEQCIKGAIEGTMDSGNFIVTYESIIPNLSSLKNYIPMLKQFWKEGLFDTLDKRYFRLINRAPDIVDCIQADLLGEYNPFNTFSQIFNADNVKKASYFDSMTHFDFKTLLPALLHVEDRMSMAHGLESRVPLLDHDLIEFVATMPANFKLKDGDMKHIFKKTVEHHLPQSIRERKDKMGFPIPLNQWIQGEAKDFVYDIFTSQKALQRDLIDNRKVLDKIEQETQFGRNVWGMLSLELWQREFHDKGKSYREFIR